MQDDITQWPVFAGVDWGGENHQLCVVAPDGRQVLQTRVSHDVAGLHQLDQHLTRFAARLPVAIERAEGLLVEHLQAAGHAVFPVSPRIAARARERYKVASVKDDRFDAFVLADTLRYEHHHWRALAVPSPLLAEIKALTRDRDRLLATQQTIESQLRIFASFPGIGPVLTAVLLAEIGEDRARFPEPAVLLAEAGLAPVTRASGRSHSVRFRYAANSRLREATMWWAFNSI